MLVASRVLLVGCIVAATLLATSCAAAVNLRALFDDFKIRYDKKYETPAEEHHRFAVFSANWKRSMDMQRTNPLATFGMSPLADLTQAEYKSRFCAYKPNKALRASFNQSASQERFTADPPKKRDWRAYGAVTPVYNQGQCGSCWAFSATEAIESRWFMYNHDLTELSMQYITSCDTNDGGCNGGDPISAYNWMLANGATIPTYASFPYSSGSGTAPACQSGGTVGATITGIVQLTKTEAYMAQWSGNYGPISICIDATSFQTYTGGIMTDCISSQVDHCVLIAGYDLTYSTPYWIIKNSWGTSWGEEGYIRVAYGSDQCLLTTEPNSVTVPGTPRTIPVNPPSPPVPTPPPPPSGSGSGSTNPTPAPSNSGSGSTNPPTAPPTPPSNSGSGSNWTTQAPSGSGSTNPPPPTPPAGNGSFTQNVCPTSACNTGCQANTFPTGQCLQLSGGGSAIVQCTAAALVLNIYQTGDCSGASSPQSQPLDQCLADTSGTYIYNTCTGGSGSGSNPTPPPPAPPSNSGSSGSHPASSGSSFSGPQLRLLRGLRHRQIGKKM